ncbi:MAG: AI-2E family transporter [Candidatus Uhrbacteria bacterium]|nr:AI-2E family transporter [Candidatus Uhrbacteria bacterium]
MPTKKTPLDHPFYHGVVARWFFLILSLGVLVLMWKVINPFAIVLATAGIAAIILTPLERKLRNWIGHPKISSLIIVVITFAAIVHPLITAGLLMVQQAYDIIRGTVANPDWVDALQVQRWPFFQLLPGIIQEQLLAIDLGAGLRSIAEWAFENVGSLFASSADFVFKTFIFFVCLFYFLFERERIVAEILRLSPLADSLDKSIVKRMTATVRGIVFGSLIVATVQGIVAGIGLTIFGVPGALIWAAAAVIAAQVPMLGTAVIMTPAIVYLFVIGQVPQAIGLALWSLIAVGLIDNILSPIVVGGRTRMNALMVLLSMLGGIKAFGPIGLVLGPTILATFIIVLELYKSGILDHRDV